MTIEISELAAQSAGLGDLTAPRYGTREGNRFQTDDPRDKGEGPFFKRKPAEVTRAGFGTGTVSVPGAALRTLGQGLESARQVVPSNEEIRQQAREQAAKMSKRDTATRLDVTIGSAQGKEFIQTVNKAAGVALARTGEKAAQTPDTQPRATLQVNGQIVDFVASQKKDNAPTYAANLDVKA